MCLVAGRERERERWLCYVNCFSGNHLMGYLRSASEFTVRSCSSSLFIWIIRCFCLAGIYEFENSKFFNLVFVWVMRKWFSKLEVIGVWNFIILFWIGSIGFWISKFWLCLVAEKVWGKKGGNCIIWIATVSLFLLFMLWGSNEFHSTQPNSLASSSSENSKWTPPKKKPIQFVAF